MRGCVRDKTTSADTVNSIPHSSPALTPQEFEFFNQHGWYVSPLILKDEEITRLEEAAEVYYSGHRDRPLPMVPPNANYWRPENGEVLRLNDYVDIEMQVFSDLASHQTITKMAAELLAASKLRVFGTLLTLKPAGDESGMIDWHKDKTYWQTCTSSNLITAWVPFQDCDNDIGTLMVIDESRSWNGTVSSLKPTSGMDTTEVVLPSGQRFETVPLGQLKRASRFEGIVKDAGGRPIVVVPLNLKKGQVSFHHSLTYHGSGKNLSSIPRKACSIHYQEGGNRYRPHYSKPGERHIYNTDHLCRRDEQGRPDYTDPAFFPEVYSRPAG